MRGRANRKPVPDATLICCVPAAARFDPVQALTVASNAVAQVTTMPGPVARRLGNRIPLGSKVTQSAAAVHRPAAPRSIGTAGLQEVAA